MRAASGADVRSRFVRCWVACCWVLAGPWLLGCASEDRAPDLFEVVALSPTSVEAGDRLELIGSGFPEGRLASVTFRGTLHRAGQEPERSFETVVRATSTTTKLLSVRVDDGWSAAFVGRGSRARHTTFRGDVVVAFAARRSGAPPLTGRLREASLDVHPIELDDEVLAERQDESARFAEFAGWDVTPGSFEVRSVRRGGRAEAAGVLAGDVLAEIDGVHVMREDDLVPIDGKRFAELLVRRGPLRQPLELELDAEGFRPTPPSELRGAAILIAVAALLLGLYVAPLTRLLTWLERRLVQRLCADERRAIASPSPARLRFIGEAFRAQSLRPGLRALPYLVFLLLSGTFTLIAVGEPLVQAELDLGMLYAATVTELGAIALVAGGMRSNRRWSLLRGLLAVGSAMAFQLPALVALACVVIRAGSVRATDLVAAQGGWPWQWHAVASPTLLVAFVLLIASCLPSVVGRFEPMPEADPGARPNLGAGGSSALFLLAEWANVFVIAGLGTVFFLGGWRVPGVELEQASGWTLALGIAVFQLKIWSLVALVFVFRWLVAHVRLHQLYGVWWRWLLPLSVVAGAGTAAWHTGQRWLPLGELEAGIRLVVFAVASGALLHASVRFARVLRKPPAQPSLNPWL